MVEPRFDRADQLERAQATRVKLVLGVIVGPSLCLAALGYYDAAATSLVLCMGLALGLVWIYERASVIEGAEGLNVFVAAGIVIALGLLWGVFARWLLSWLFD